jgi:hypothetical protein
MNPHRSILAWVLALVIGVALSAGGCASGGSDSGSSGDDGAPGDAIIADATQDGGCAAGKTKCGTTCVSTTNDPKNCGRCGLKCGTGEVCSKGTCGVSCSPPETLCGGPMEAGSGSGGDSSAGGEGGDDSGDATAESGDDASTVQDATVTGDGGVVQPYCANLTNDPANCGMCGNNCGSNGTCSGSMCVLSCPKGQKPCFANNTCIPSNTCCQSGECTITGEVCPMPGGTCSCPTGEKECMANMQCISSMACCSAADCTVTGQSCPTPGQPCKCMASLQCCVATDCGPEQNVTAYTCGTPNPANTCGIAMCKSGCYDVDKTFSTGCECCVDKYGQTCATATAAAGLTVGGAKQSFTGQIPTQGGGDWFTASFSGETNIAFHALITLSVNPNSEFVFDVVSGSCTGSALNCLVESGQTSTGKTTWEEFYGTPMPPEATPVPTVGTLFIHVYRANTSAPATCDQFTLDISE